MNEILKYLKKPELYEKSILPFWDDVHISNEMLKAHLNPNIDAASRKPEYIDKSVEWLTSIIPGGSSILDLGCGPGLYTKRLSDKDYLVTGIDISKRSIEYAQSVDKKTTYINMNYLTFEPLKQFDAIIMIYCDYAALVVDDRIKLLEIVKNALKPGGLFVFDVFTNKQYENVNENRSWYVSKNGFWAEEEHLCLEGFYCYKNNTIFANRYIVVTDVIKDYIIWDTIYSQVSITNEIYKGGLVVKNIYSDCCGKEYDDESKTLCCVCTK